VLNINLEINEEMEHPSVENNMPTSETMITSVNVNEEDVRTISTAITSSVSIDIPAARGETSRVEEHDNTDEPSGDNSEASGARINLLGINNSIAQGIPISFV